AGGGWLGFCGVRAGVVHGVKTAPFIEPAAVRRPGTAAASSGARFCPARAVAWVVVGCAGIVAWIVMDAQYVRVVNPRAPGPGKGALKGFRIGSPRRGHSRGKQGRGRPDRVVVVGAVPVPAGGVAGVRGGGGGCRRGGGGVGPF